MAGHDKVTAQGKRFLKELQNLSEKQVRVGLKRGKKGKRHNGTSSQTDLVDIALYNELGTSTIPARPFLRRRYRYMRKKSGKRLYPKRRRCCAETKRRSRLFGR